MRFDVYGEMENVGFLPATELKLKTQVCILSELHARRRCSSERRTRRGVKLEASSAGKGCWGRTRTRSEAFRSDLCALSRELSCQNTSAECYHRSLSNVRQCIRVRAANEVLFSLLQAVAGSPAQGHCPAMLSPPGTLTPGAYGRAYRQTHIRHTLGSRSVIHTREGPGCLMLFKPLLLNTCILECQSADV